MPRSWLPRSRPAFDSRDRCFDAEREREGCDVMHQTFARKDKVRLEAVTPRPATEAKKCPSGGREYVLEVSFLVTRSRDR